jgi:hypothetical protein
MILPGDLDPCIRGFLYLRRNEQLDAWVVRDQFREQWRSRNGDGVQISDGGVGHELHSMHEHAPCLGQEIYEGELP